jgi:hypothetical protein
MGDMPIPGSPAPSRDELIEHLVRTRIAGDVATPRENNLSHYRALANGDRYYWFGLEFGDRWADEQDVLAVMAERVGVIDDPSHRVGQDTIDPELTVSGLERMAARLRKAAEDNQRVLLATGHPGGLLDVHRATVVQFADVAVVERGANLWHTHAGDPMRAILHALTEDGRPLPELVVADHGWAGAAAQHGVDAVGYADCNDPALFVAEAEGTLQVAVPLDDHVHSPRYYDPMTAYLLTAAGLYEDRSAG